MQKIQIEGGHLNGTSKRTFDPHIQIFYKVHTETVHTLLYNKKIPL